MGPSKHFLAFRRSLGQQQGSEASRRSPRSWHIICGRHLLSAQKVAAAWEAFSPPDLTVQSTQALRLRAPCLFTIMILSCVHKHTSPKCFSSRAGNFFHLPSLLFLPLPVATRGNLSPSSQSPRQRQKIAAATPHKTAVNYLAAKVKHKQLCVTLYREKSVAQLGPLVETQLFACLRDRCYVSCHFIKLSS